jgi:hypothetical protein
MQQQTVNSQHQIYPPLDDQQPSTSTQKQSVQSQPAELEPRANTLTRVPQEPVITIRTPMIVSQPSTSSAHDKMQKRASIDVASPTPAAPAEPMREVRIAPEVQRHQYSPGPDLRPPAGGNDSPPQSHASSRTSLNVWSDHFEQYTGKTAKYLGPNKIGRGRASQAAHAQVDDEPTPLGPTGKPILYVGGDPNAALLTRRSTLGSTRDYRAPPPPPKAIDDSAPTAAAQKLMQAVGDDKGSLPELHAIDAAPVVLSREEVARMSSQRRQEVIRIHEEEELIRANPLRYLFHPAVRVSA